MQFHHTQVRHVKLSVRGFNPQEIAETFLVTSYRFIEPCIEKIISVNWKITFLNRDAKEILTENIETQFEYFDSKDIEKDFQDLRTFLAITCESIIYIINCKSNNSACIQFDADRLTYNILSDVILKTS
jgi:hypothetical protein